ncbi:MAG: MBL fold metallo-hydrolase [Chthoniobacteraceae bacterium]
MEPARGRVLQDGGGGVILKRYYVEGLAHASYLVGAGGEAAVVDPKRDVDDYIADAAAKGLRIVAILETHPHADFVSGHVELARRTGAKIYISHLAKTAYERVPLRDGDVIPVGGIEIVAMETPGHSPDSVSWLVREDGRPVHVFTGDTLFVGDVGRPDLRDADEKPTVLADALYDSLFTKLLALPDETEVHPAHGAGSLCGRKISSAPFTTIGQERADNWALAIRERAEFVEAMVANLPDRPAYFAHDVQMNLQGAKPLSELPGLRALSEEELKAGGIVIDTRSAAAFGAGHFPGSVNIGIDAALFSTWVGFIVPFGRPIALVTASADDATRARLELARIGYDDVPGFIEAGALTRTHQLSQLSVCDLRTALHGGEAPLVLDVRTPGEWTKQHIDGALHVPLPSLPRRLEQIPRDRALAVMCGSGYRSSIAASLLMANGFTKLQNVMGGMAAFLEADCPLWQPADLVFAEK